MGGSAITDTELLGRIARRDRTAVRPLFERHHRRLYRYLVRMVRDEGMAEELANEVFLEVWRGAARFEGRSSAQSWIFGIAHNKAVSALRKRREVGLDEAWAAEIEDPAETPAEAAEREDVGRLIRGCLDRLSTEHREVTELAYYQEMSIRTIADAVGIPENTVKTRMFHARRRLAECLRATGLEGDVP